MRGRQGPPPISSGRHLAVSNPSSVSLQYSFVDHRTLELVPRAIGFQSPAASRAIRSSGAVVGRCSPAARRGSIQL